jgi:hypothetical protein
MPAPAAPVLELPPLARIGRQCKRAGRCRRVNRRSGRELPRVRGYEMLPKKLAQGALACACQYSEVGPPGSAGSGSDGAAGRADMRWPLQCRNGYARLWSTIASSGNGRPSSTLGSERPPSSNGGWRRIGGRLVKSWTAGKSRRNSGRRFTAAGCLASSTIPQLRTTRLSAGITSYRGKIITGSG